jgi:uncharacterized membrane protein
MQTLGPGPDSGQPPRNPFEPPKARVYDPGPAAAGRLLDSPRTVEMGRGFGWLGDGWSLFKEAPGAWMGVVVVWIVLSVVINLVPMLNLLSSVLNPVLAGGMMYGCHSLATGRGLAVGHLFEGFQRQFGPLARIGLISLLASVLIIGGAFFGFVGVSGAFSVLLGEGAPTGVDPLMLLLALLGILSLMVPLAMALWFAPALAMLHGVPALRAMNLSFQACLRNLLPFLAYGLGGLGLALLATIPLGLGWLVLLPVMVASTYAAYRDLFTE